MKKLPKLVLLDRDGVINADVGAPGVIDPKQLELTPHAGHAIARLKENGVSVAMITNQSCVGKGLISEVELGVIQDHVQKLLQEQNELAVIDEIYQCTSTKEENDPRMKPNPGMLIEAMRDFGVKAPEECCFVGDTQTDLEAAIASKVPHRILVSTGYGEGLMKGWAPEQPTPLSSNSDRETDLPEDIFPIVYCKNLLEAVDWILSSPLDQNH